MSIGGFLKFHERTTTEVDQTNAPDCSKSTPPVGSANTAAISVPIPTESIEDCSDQQLIDLHIHHHHEQAFAEIVHRYRPRLIWVARRYGSCEADAEDIVQESLLKAARKLHTYRGEAALGTWLYRLVMNTGYDHVNTAAKHRERTILDAADDSGRTILDRQAIEPFRTKDLQLLLVHALNQLTYDQRQAIVLVDCAGISVTEVARMHGVQPGTIKSRRARARKQLQEILGRDPWD